MRAPEKEQNRKCSGAECEVTQTGPLAHFYSDICKIMNKSYTIKNNVMIV